MQVVLNVKWLFRTTGERTSAITAYISRADGCPCGGTTIKLL